MTISLIQHELSQDPHDFIATHLLLHATSGLTGSAVQFGAAYLLSHGVVKMVLIAALLRERNPPQCQRPRRTRPRPGFGRVVRDGQPSHIDLRQAILRASGGRPAQPGGASSSTISIRCIAGIRHSDSLHACQEMLTLSARAPVSAATLTANGMSTCSLPS